MNSIRKTVLKSWLRHANTIKIKPYAVRTTAPAMYKKKPARKRVYKRKKKALARQYRKTILARHAMKTRKYKYKRNCGCSYKKNPLTTKHREYNERAARKGLTLSQWASKFDEVVLKHKNGSKYVNAIPGTDAARALFSLKDYAVDSYFGGVYWMIKK